MAASAIDLRVAEYMHRIDPWLLPVDDAVFQLAWSDRINVAIRTLVRGQVLGLPSGETMAQFVHDRLRDDQPTQQILTHQQILDASTTAVREFLETEAQGKELHGCTPLWMYVLCEAVHHHGGQRLGPLGSRIVLETIHASIEAAGDSIVQNGLAQRFTPDRELVQRSTDQYELRDMVETVELKWHNLTKSEGGNHNG